MSTAVRGMALVRPPTADLSRGIVTHIARTPVDVELAVEQHAAYCDALAAAGWSIHAVEAAPGCPDAVFIEDTVVVIERTAVLTRPGAPSRRNEVPGVEDAVRELGLDLGRIEGSGTLDGGDVLQVGNRVYVGRGGRTNAEGIRQLRTLLHPHGRTVVPVQLEAVLHLKSAVTALPDRTFLALPELLEAGVFPPTRPVDEEAGCHVVALDHEQVLISASAPRTADRLSDLGFTPVVVEIGEFEKLEGCVTCLSVLVPAGLH